MRIWWVVRRPVVPELPPFGWRLMQFHAHSIRKKKRWCGALCRWSDARLGHQETSKLPICWIRKRAWLIIFLMHISWRFNMSVSEMVISGAYSWIAKKAPHLMQILGTSDLNMWNYHRLVENNRVREPNMAGFCRRGQKIVEQYMRFRISPKGVYGLHPKGVWINMQAESRNWAHEYAGKKKRTILLAVHPCQYRLVLHNWYIIHGQYIGHRMPSGCLFHDCQQTWDYS